MEQVEATVRETIYRNAENGYSVVQVKAGQRLTTVVGVLPEMSSGEQVIFTGEWMEHPQYGRQLRCTSCQIQKPTSLLGIERYLGSGLIRGVGPSTAKQIVEHFGMETMEVLTEHPERLQEVHGMGRKRWRQIAESFQEQQAARESMIFLQSYGIPANLSVKISKLYGERTADLEKPSDIEADRALYHTAERLLHFSCTPQTVLAATLCLADIQRSNIINIIEGVRYGLPVAQINAFLKY